MRQQYNRQCSINMFKHLKKNWMKSQREHSFYWIQRVPIVKRSIDCMFSTFLSLGNGIRHPLLTLSMAVLHVLAKNTHQVVKTYVYADVKLLNPSYHMLMHD
jgi:hypothetical protein